MAVTSELMLVDVEYRSASPAPAPSLEALVVKLGQDRRALEGSWSDGNVVVSHAVLNGGEERAENGRNDDRISIALLDDPDELKELMRTTLERAKRVLRPGNINTMGTIDARIPPRKARADSDDEEEDGADTAQSDDDDEDEDFLREAVPIYTDASVELGQATIAVVSPLFAPCAIGAKLASHNEHLGTKRPELAALVLAAMLAPPDVPVVIWSDSTTAIMDASKVAARRRPVSYTHLTLPTMLPV